MSRKNDLCMEKKILSTIKKYKLIESGDSLVVGVSGGPDSISLLNYLIGIKNNEKIGLDFSIFVAHINHSIRDDADEDEEYVKSFCKMNEIVCFIKKENVIEKSQKEKIGTEEAGRKLRYDFFDEVMQKTHSNKIVTAHTANDNAETVIMNLIRGTGLSGVKGIEPFRDEKYIRPLIECTREEIENYCEEHKLNPRYDKTNKENIYTRNKVRNLLIPYIEKEFNPNIIETINRFSSIVEEENGYIYKKVKESYNNILIQQDKNIIALDLKLFNNLENVIKKRIVLYTINKLFGTSQGIERIHILDIIKLCENNIGNKFLTPNKKLKILVKNKKIFFVSNIEFP